MDYKKMITEYATNGGDEKKMWASVDVTAEALDYIEEVAPEKHECLMRKLHEALYGKHYCEEVALHDVAKLHYLDKNGVEHHGAHWTVEDVKTATANKSFDKSVTQWDKYVAYNVMYSDLCSQFDDTQILNATYLFWFADRDWQADGKIWDYMTIKSNIAHI